MTTFRKLVMTTCVAAGALASAFTLAMSPASADEAKKFKIFLSLSYSGNAWQSEAANMVKALAQTPPYDKMVELKEVDPRGKLSLAAVLPEGESGDSAADAPAAEAPVAWWRGRRCTGHR